MRWAICTERTLTQSAQRGWHSRDRGCICDPGNVHVPSPGSSLTRGNNSQHSLDSPSRGAVRGGCSNQRGSFKRPLGPQPPHSGPSCPRGDAFCPLYDLGCLPPPSRQAQAHFLQGSLHLKLFLNYAGQSAFPVEGH